jgi:hypothetical protein
MAFLRAKMRQVDTGKRVGRLHPELRAARHFFKAMTGFQNRKGAFQPPQVINRNLRLG